MWASTPTTPPRPPARADRVVCGYEKPRRVYRGGDAGVAIYALMALTSYTGTALVVRGRKWK